MEGVEWESTEGSVGSVVGHRKRRKMCRVGFRRKMKKVGWKKSSRLGYVTWAQSLRYAYDAVINSATFIGPHAGTDR